MKKRKQPARKRPQKRKAAATAKTTRRPRRAKSKSKPSETDLLTLKEVAKRTDIPYQTLRRYVERYLDEIPHRGEGRRRRYPLEAVAAFKRIRRGGHSPTRTADGKAAAPARQLGSELNTIEKGQARIAKQLKELIQILDRPLQVRIRR